MNTANTRRLAALILAVTLTTQLAACFPLAVAGAAAGTMAAIDRRTVGAQTEDKGIDLRAMARINERFGDRVHVSATSYNRKVLLTGEVPDTATRSAVQTIVAGIENVASIVNELEVLPHSSMSTRANDSLITGQAKAALIDTNDLFASSFKIVTERNVVYLMGRVTQREGNRAGDIIRNLRGVQKVVKVLEYITEDELKRLQTQPAPPEAAPTETRR